MFTTPDMRELMGQGWLAAMLEVEGALAAAESKAGLIPAGAAEAIRRACLESHLDAERIGEETVASLSPVVPLVDQLRRAVPTRWAQYVHFGATSQDVVDTAMMLLSRRGTTLVLEDVLKVAGACAELARAHRGTVMAGRTLLQQALPTTLGLKCAGWLQSLIEARANLRRVSDERLAVQLGGAAGTLAAMGGEGLVVGRYLAEELGLREPTLPWHTTRLRIVELAAALGIVAGATGKIALDLALLSQTEVGEVRFTAGGRSSAMPHKRNPSAVVASSACVRRALVLVPLFFQSMLQEHERAAGTWQAEWESLGQLFELTHAAVRNLLAAFETLEVVPESMALNLGRAGGLIMTEAVAVLLAERLGAGKARRVADAASARALASGISLRQALLDESAISPALTEAELDTLLDPHAYLGASSELLDRALAAFERESATAHRAAD
jgi:3-carboxy-cis,cis-muconate cycloisomerase